jgi:hypothetical protein
MSVSTKGAVKASNPTPVRDQADETHERAQDVLCQMKTLAFFLREKSLKTLEDFEEVVPGIAAFLEDWLIQLETITNNLEYLVDEPRKARA